MIIVLLKGSHPQFETFQKFIPFGGVYGDPESKSVLVLPLYFVFKET